MQIIMEENKRKKERKDILAKTCKLSLCRPQLLRQVVIMSIRFICEGHHIASASVNIQFYTCVSDLHYLSSKSILKWENFDLISRIMGSRKALHRRMIIGHECFWDCPLSKHKFNSFFFLIGVSSEYAVYRKKVA